MLVLSRHKNQTICIGNDITITIVDVRGDKVRIGIDAPTSVPVHRKEVYDAIQRQAAPPPPKAPLASFLPATKENSNECDG